MDKGIQRRIKTSMKIAIMDGPKRFALISQLATDENVSDCKIKGLCTYLDDNVNWELMNTCEIFICGLSCATLADFMLQDSMVFDDMKIMILFG